MSNDTCVDQWPPKPKRRKTRFLKRHIVTSDHHGFIGRIYELGIVSLNFDSYAELARFPDCKYAIDTGDVLRNLTRRVESLNLVGDLLWPDPFPRTFADLPINPFEWLTISADVFLVRYVSVIDCSLLLTNQVFQFDVPPRKCDLQRLVKCGLPAPFETQFKIILEEQEHVRAERNARIHHGHERPFTDDDATFKSASSFKMIGTDMYGRKINVDLSFREGLVGLQRNFNIHVQKLERSLDIIYDLLWHEFEERFGPLIASANHGLNAGSRNSNNCGQPIR